MYTKKRTVLPAAYGPASHPRRRAILSLTLAGLTGLTAAGAALFSTCTFCYAVSSGDERIYVQESAACAAAVQTVENRVSRILQTEYTCEPPAVTPAIAPKEAVQTSDELTDSLMETVEQVKYAYVLYIDGVSAGACDSREAVDAALWQAKDRFLTGDTVSVSIENTVEVVPTYLPADRETLDAPELAARLLDPGEAEAPVLSVRTVEEVTATRPIPAPVEGREDDSLLLGQSVTLQEGQDGTEEYTQRTTRLSGEEIDRETLSTSVLTQPIPSVVAVGTLEGVEGAKGRFQWPCTGEITSPFGERHIFGSVSSHTGLDIALKKGSPIAASADGTVVWSGRQGTYGNLLIVDHHNGFTTCYAHCSALLADEGDEVKQGEVIAKVGSTGRSTGPHCHFEIRWREEPLDPQLCLP